ncbi:phospholipase effector Tle1 domain-containing protein [Bradyrhizobium barranii]
MTQHDGAQNGDSARPKHTHDDASAAGTTATTLSKRKLVLFADGTGNAFTAQESSVWRLYEALDHTQPDQIAHYIKGVGTAGWAPLAAIDGATGIGVPSNVRKLYRFLCWNWREGDEIYIFGFSRGAFTARTLAALIASQGLVPAEIKGEPVSHAEMERNAMSAWREYRKRIGGLSEPADDLDCALDSRPAAHHLPFRLLAPLLLHGPQGHGRPQERQD